jgi:hypothetical protein
MSLDAAKNISLVGSKICYIDGTSFSASTDEFLVLSYCPVQKENTIVHVNKPEKYLNVAKFLRKNKSAVVFRVTPEDPLFLYATTLESSSVRKAKHKAVLKLQDEDEKPSGDEEEVAAEPQPRRRVGRSNGPDGGKCVVCLDAQAIFVVTPCGHVCYCAECCVSFQPSCPFCRGQAGGLMRIFYP